MLCRASCLALGRRGEERCDPSSLFAQSVGKTDTPLSATWCVDCYNKSMHMPRAIWKRGNQGMRGREGLGYY